MGKPAATDRPRLRSLSHSFTPDFIMTGSSPELLEHEVKPRVVQLLGERGLELSPTKTHLTSIEDGFDFLGQHLRKYAGKLLIKPARKNRQTFLGGVLAKRGQLTRPSFGVLRTFGASRVPGSLPVAEVPRYPQAQSLALGMCQLLPQS